MQTHEFINHKPVCLLAVKTMPNDAKSRETSNIHQQHQQHHTHLRPSPSHSSYRTDKELESGLAAVSDVNQQDEEEELNVNVSKRRLKVDNYHKVIYGCNGFDSNSRCLHGGLGPVVASSKDGRLCTCLCLKSWGGPECGTYFGQLNDVIRVISDVIVYKNSQLQIIDVHRTILLYITMLRGSL